MALRRRRHARQYISSTSAASSSSAAAAAAAAPAPAASSAAGAASSSTSAENIPGDRPTPLSSQVVSWVTAFGSIMPLPPLIADGAAAFRDWTAWAVGLLAPHLWIADQNTPTWSSLPVQSPSEPAALVRALVAAAVARVENAPDPTRLSPQLKARVRSTAKTQMQKSFEKVTAFRVVHLASSLHHVIATHVSHDHSRHFAIVARLVLSPLWNQLTVHSIHVDVHVIATLLKHAITRVDSFTHSQLQQLFLTGCDPDQASSSQPVPSPSRVSQLSVTYPVQSKNIAVESVHPVSDSGERKNFQLASRTMTTNLPSFVNQDQCIHSQSRSSYSSLPSQYVTEDFDEVVAVSEPDSISEAQLSIQDNQRQARGAQVVRCLQIDDYAPSATNLSTVHAVGSATDPGSSILPCGDVVDAAAGSNYIDRQHWMALQDTRPTKRPRSVSISASRKARLREVVQNECQALAERHGSQIQLDISEEFGLPIVVCQVLVPELRLPKLVLRVASGYSEGITGADYGFERPALGWTGLLAEIRQQFRADIAALPSSSITVAAFIDAWTSSVLCILRSKSNY